MKTFGLFILLLLLNIIILSVIFTRWNVSEIIIESTLLSYIYQQYFTEEIVNK
jgi:hypothetical protein